MMPTMMEASYQHFSADAEDSEETPQGSGVMIHVVPESGRAARWNHIEDLDSFFVRIYHYHQEHGFACMMLQEVLELLQFIFVVFFSTFLFNCVSYRILFRDEVSNRTANYKISLSDVMLSSDECIANMGATNWSVILVAVVCWLLRALKVIYHLFQYWDVKAFYNSALKINDSELDNVTWHEIQRRLREVQLEQQMCIHKKDLSELDIYHRILRFKNYMVAMVNKSLIPVRLNLPFIGEVVYLSHGLKYNIELLLFWGPWSPFENNWHLKEDYKKVNKRQDLAHSLAKHILYVAVANLLLCPLILLWQILYSFYNYAEILKREPGSLGIRCWSLYGRLYLRHFNELEHEMNARLNRAYRPASKYMNIFTSPLMTVIAKNLVFITGACLAVLLMLTIYDEDVLTVEHVLTTITILGVIVAVFRVFIPDENLVWCPEALMTAVLAHVHYLPDSWRGQAHMHTVRAQLAQLFQYKATYLLGELVSPVLTPLVLCFYVRPRALDIVDFYRNFTVEVVGVGDVCSFAQMDVRRHGNPTWQAAPLRPPATDKYTQAEDGKTELSLVHFTHTNPSWRAPAEAETFIAALREQTRRNVNFANNTVLAEGNSLSSVGMGLNSMLMQPQMCPGAAESLFRSPTSPGGVGNCSVMTRISRTEGPLIPPHSAQIGLLNPSLGASLLSHAINDDHAPETTEYPIIDMSLSTLCLHELHHRQLSRRGYSAAMGGRAWDRTQPEETNPRREERTPLLVHPSTSQRL